MFDRTFGAVARDVPDEVRDLETITIRNQRFPKNPLSEYFLADLFAPVEASEVFAFRDDRRKAAIELADFMEHARSQHWEAIEGPHRPVYNWRSGSIESRWDYPAWTHRTAINLMYRAESAFQHGGEADSDNAYSPWPARCVLMGTSLTQQ